jgi:hypothetical protein
LRIVGDVAVEHAADRAFARQVDRAPRHPQQLAGIGAGVAQMALQHAQTRAQASGAHHGRRHDAWTAVSVARKEITIVRSRDDHRRRWCGGMRH